MNLAAPAYEQLTNQVADLRAPRAEASDTLRAIRSGEVDAVLVQGPRPLRSGSLNFRIPL